MGPAGGRSQHSSSNKRLSGGGWGTACGGSRGLQWGEASDQAAGEVDDGLFFSTGFPRMPSFKIESSGYWSKINLDSVRKVNIGTGKGSWQKTPPGLPQTGRTIQAMAKIGSTSTEAMKALNRSQGESSNREAKPQNSIFGPDYNQSCCCICLTASPFPQKLQHCGEVRVAAPYLFSLQLRTQNTFLSVLSFATKNLNDAYFDCILPFTTEGKKYIDWIIYFFLNKLYSHYIALSW